MVQKNRCLQCGQKFNPVRSDQMFCSRRCRAKYHRGTTKAEYCIDCLQSYQNLNTLRWICRKTGKIVVGTDGRGTVNAMNCH